MEYSNTKIIGGYDANFLDKFLDDYECPVCKLVFREPIQTQCGHRLCLSCSEEIKKRNGGILLCPLDKKISNFDRIFRDKAFKRVIMQLHVKCDNYIRNCHWTGELKIINKHLKSCEYQEVKCINKQCSNLLLRKELKDHMETHCLYRFVRCQYCYRKICYIMLQAHFENCNCFPVDCVNQCGLSILRKEMPSHIANYCAFSLIPCQYFNIGCNFQL
ncbi:TNF receptor-associated factor 5 isoform X1 [Hydra vulgaris]|uniref:TNF receptor-associated factor 5 isoform X1 n=1 Tax=Hydra vulgaris TaxID=6087 RepID=UPI0032E9CD92